MENKDEGLIKLNLVKQHNEIIKLERQKKELEEKYKNMYLDLKDKIAEYEDKNNEIIKNKNIAIEKLSDENMKQTLKIKDLEEKNKNLIDDKVAYKNAWAKMPKFIIRIFGGKKLAEGEEK